MAGGRCGTCATCGMCVVKGRGRRRRRRGRLVLRQPRHLHLWQLLQQHLLQRLLQHQLQHRRHQQLLLLLQPHQVLHLRLRLLLSHLHLHKQHHPHQQHLHLQHLQHLQHLPHLPLLQFCHLPLDRRRFARRLGLARPANLLRLAVAPAVSTHRRRWPLVVPRLGLEGTAKAARAVSAATERMATDQMATAPTATAAFPRALEPARGAVRHRPMAVAAEAPRRVRSTRRPAHRHRTAITTT